MSFFENPWPSEFRGNWVLGDRQHIPEFICPRNNGRGDTFVISWAVGDWSPDNMPTYDLTGVDADGNPTRFLSLRYTLDSMNFKTWGTITVDLTAVIMNVTQIVNALNADAIFADYFTAATDLSLPDPKVKITQKIGINRFKFYIINGGAEEVLRFNARIGVAELPTYMARHVVDDVTFPDSVNMLIALNPANSGGGSFVDSDVIENAVDEKGVPLGFDSNVVREDWQLLRGRAGIFNFQKITVDGLDRITEIIEYPAGALAGDLSRKINYTYTGGNLHPDQITEIPYTLQAADLVTP